MNNPLEELDIVMEFQRYLVDVTREIKEKPYLFYYGGVGFSPLGNIMAIKSHAKNGKTQLTKILMAAALCGECLGISAGVQNANILYCDTEMDADDTTLVAQGVLTLCHNVDAVYQYNVPNERFHALSLRTVSTEQRWTLILQAIEYYHPQLVVIDGVRDLITDFNSLEESSNIINELLKTSTEHKCCIWNILHQNKNDDNMRGHLGTELVNKVTDVLETKKSQEMGETIFTVTQTETRNRDINKFIFGISEFGVPCAPAMGAASRNELAVQMKTAYDDLWARHNNSTGEDGRFQISLRKADFVDSVMQTLNLKKTKAYDLIKEAELQGIIAYDTVSKQVMFRGKIDEVPF